LESMFRTALARFAARVLARPAAAKTEAA
jgi:hypothetical protein